MYTKDIIIIICTFCLLLYICLGVDYYPENYVKYLSDPLVKFLVLCLICLALHHDDFLALIIIFSYFLTVLKYNPVLKSANFTSSSTLIEDSEDINGHKLVDSNLVEETKENELKYLNEKSLNNSDFTSDFQFNDAQSNIVDDDALETEVRTWKDGYGTQGGFDLES